MKQFREIYQALSSTISSSGRMSYCSSQDQSLRAILSIGFKNNAFYFRMEDTVVQTVGLEAKEINALT